MRKLSKFTLFFAAIILLVEVFLPTVSLAMLIETPNNSTTQGIELNIQAQRPYNDDNGDSQVGNDIYNFDANGTTGKTQKVLKIGDYTNNSFSFNEAQNLYYCLNWGIGFGNSDSNTTIPLQNAITYFYKGNLLDNNNENLNTIFSSIVNINAIRWMADKFYVPNAIGASNTRAKLLQDAGIPNSELTDDDIDVVQQFALWYFIDDEIGKDKTLPEFEDYESLYSTLHAMQLENFRLGESFLSVNQNDIPEGRAADITILFNYLVRSRDYIMTNPELKINSSNFSLSKDLSIEEDVINNYNVYKIGPFRIDELNQNDNYFNFSYKFEYKDSEQGEFITLNTAETAYFVLDDDRLQNLTINGEDATLYYDITKKINNGEFYIVVLKEDDDIISTSRISNITNFKLSINYDYYNTLATVWSGGDDTQPVLKVEKVKESPEDEVLVGVPQRQFDLSLRKFITSTTSTGEVDRVPRVSLETLKNGTYNRKGVFEHTATYNHSKDPILLKRGDSIIYTIRVYNEGDIDGYATQITDFLSDELELVADSTINTTYGWEVDASNSKIIRTSYLANKLIKAYDSEMTESEAIRSNLSWQKAVDGTDGLYYEDIQIECKIIDGANTNVRIPNVAEITADLATGEDIADRDSVPGTIREDDVRNIEDTHWYQDDDDFEVVIIQPFDLSLRKYITRIIRGENTLLVFDSREPDIDTTDLFAGTAKTAEYKHKKDPIEVETNDIIIYNITIYNEGDQAGRATKVVDQLPTGLEFVGVYSGNFELDNYDRTLNKVTLREKTTNYNLREKDLFDERQELNSTTIELECKVVATVANRNQVLTNIAWIAEEYNAVTEATITTEVGLDRDSEPGTAPSEYLADQLNTEEIGYTGKTQHTEQELADSNTYFEGEQDDDDFEKVILKGKYFDLALRKYISNIERNGNIIELPSREPSEDTTNLVNGIYNEEKQKTEYTATYTHTKEPVTVKQGDIITYTLRVYNEGELDGYVKEITDYLPDGLGFIFINDEESINNNVDWSFAGEEVASMPLVGENGWYKNEENVPTDGVFKDEDLSKITIVYGKDNAKLKLTNDVLKEEKLNKYDAENDVLDYKEVRITAIVLAPNTYDGPLVNYAEISKDQAVDIIEGREVEVDVNDRDSNPNNINLNDYELRDENSMYQQDDDDYEPLQLKYFDLALRKFITGVNTEEVTSRIPEFYIDEDGNYKYRHPKDPVYVVDKDTVTYTIRVFNEGTIAGYAEEVEDDIPEGLVFLPENETNIEYRWKMFYRDENDELVETEDVTEAEVIRTDYLSEENGTINEETGINSNLLSVFDKATMQSPDYRDIKVSFKVSQVDIPEENTERIIINKAHITKDSDDDEDSIPDEWNEGEDDQDLEKIYVQEFDLALYKWVTETRVTVDGKTTTTETAFKPNVGLTEGIGENYRENSEPEPIAKVELDKKKLKSTVVKFVYNIKVVNEGDIEGKALEITDYIPEGLEFVAEDNPLWTLGEKEGTITTRALETISLEPGKSATVPVIFTWKNDANNLGLKTNVAAITEDYNDKNIPDIDSVPGNEDMAKYDKEQEDDDDFALVILTLKTGTEVKYIGLILGFIVIIAAGTTTIKKFVL